MSKPYLLFNKIYTTKKHYQECPNKTFTSTVIIIDFWYDINIAECNRNTYSYWLKVRFISIKNTYWHLSFSFHHLPFHWHNESVYPDSWNFDARWNIENRYPWSTLCDQWCKPVPNYKGNQNDTHEKKYIHLQTCWLTAPINLSRFLKFWWAFEYWKSSPIGTMMWFVVHTLDFN